MVHVILEERGEVPAEETPAPQETQPETPEKSSAGLMMIIVLIVLAGVGGGYYYLKIYKPKKEEESWESEHMETDDGLETVNEDEDEGEEL